MRITLNLEDDVLEQVRRFADSRSLPVGKAISELVRSGLTAPRPTMMVNGFQVVDLAPDSPTVTSEDVRRREGDLL